MKLRILPCLLAFLLLASCKPWRNVSAEYDPRFEEIPVLGIASVAEVGYWVVSNIQYVPDTIHDTPEYFQSPDQTYTWRTGDCEDFAILMMYLIHVELGGWPQLAIGTFGSGDLHAWVIYGGRWYGAQGGGDFTGTPGYTLLEAIPYGEAMWRSMNTHRAIGELKSVEE